MTEAGKEVEVQVHVVRRRDGLYTVTLNKRHVGGKMSGCTWNEALKMMAEVAPPGSELCDVAAPGLFAKPDVNSAAEAFAKLSAAPFLSLDRLGREIQDGQKEWSRHLRAVADAQAARKAQERLNDQQSRESQRCTPADAHSLESYSRKGQESTDELLQAFVQVLQFVLRRS